MNYISETLSINMFTVADFTLIRVRDIRPDEVPRNVISAIDHEETAALVSNIVGFEVPCNRMSVKFSEGDRLYVAQYSGPCIKEGAKIDFFEVTLKSRGCKGCAAMDCNTCSMMQFLQGY